jgi:lipooligosaccharide transport system ATP-binding protein
LRVGVLPQLDNLDPDFTVFENLLVYGRYFGLADALISSRIP